jgi:four helix bundle protein
MQREPARRFEDLLTWQKSHALTLRVYRLTISFPKHETFGLISQMRRAAVSTAANIAEGFSRKGRADKAKFMNIAQGSLEELRYYTILARDLEYVAKTEQWDDLEEAARLLGAYTRTLQTPIPLPSS